MAQGGGHVERYTVPTLQLVGEGAVAYLGEELKKLGVTRPLIVTDRGVRQAHLLEHLLAGLGELGPRAAVFDRVHPNPREEDVLAALEVYREERADGIVAMGGGSPIDAAKALRVLVHHPGSIADYDLRKRGGARITEALPPMAAVPTTAGTGSEVSRGALILTEEGGVRRKTIVASSRLVPSLAVLDPRLTVTLPPELTAATGIDALSHAIEEVSSPRRHAAVEALALAAAGKIAGFLERAVEAPDDIEARLELLEAAMMAGVGFEKGLGAVHSLSHALGALTDLHHGTLNAVLLPAVLEFNRGHLPREAPLLLAAAAGLDALDDDGAVSALTAWLRELNERLGLPGRLRGLGDLEGLKAQAVSLALEDHCHLTNPRRCDAAAFEAIWDLAW